MVCCLFVLVPLDVKFVEVVLVVERWQLVLSWTSYAAF